MAASAVDALEVVRAELGDADARRDRERIIETGLRYGDDTPVAVRVRKRGRHYEVDDDGLAVRTARRLGAREWEAVANEVVEAHDLRLNRRGIVLVPSAQEEDLAWLVFKVARCSYAVHAELLEHAT
jgi:hypothetical protein